MVVVLSVIWLLYKQAVQVSVRVPEFRGPVSVFVSFGQIFLRGPGRK